MYERCSGIMWTAFASPLLEKRFFFLSQTMYKKMRADRSAQSVLWEIINCLKKLKCILLSGLFFRKSFRVIRIVTILKDVWTRDQAVLKTTMWKCPYSLLSIFRPERWTKTKFNCIYHSVESFLFPNQNLERFFSSKEIMISV